MMGSVDRRARPPPGRGHGPGSWPMPGAIRACPGPGPTAAPGDALTARSRTPRGPSEFLAGSRPAGTGRLSLAVTWTRSRRPGGHIISSVIYRVAARSYYGSTIGRFKGPSGLHLKTVAMPTSLPDGFKFVIFVMSARGLLDRVLLDMLRLNENHELLSC
eukprot:757185-Hanusia_phi.AAC.1